ncbi:pyruvate dehydrogenase protein x mitochondrial- hypothetical protein [Limosa lapponica baueri]|uniref:Uncharacterized protein n=1 Tax=Limosa lapponica baueri TaxID=1758121 RepID=A0A2I0UCM9_LIMLA|nr:pyruvate dehydrogenase protein x mitochondrial- hypothetical protein [Limosa lapponica baueri]
MSALPETETGTSTRKKKNQDQGDPVSSSYQAEGSNLKKRTEGKQTGSLPTSASQVSLYNSYEALDVEGQSIGDVDDGPATPEVLPRSERHTPYIMIKFLILRKTRREASKTASMDFWRADFGLFKSLLDRFPWEAVLKGKVVQEG